MNKGDKVWVPRSNGGRTIAEVYLVPSGIFEGGNVCVRWTAWFKKPEYAGVVDLTTECEAPPDDSYIPENLTKWVDPSKLEVITCH